MNLRVIQDEWSNCTRCAFETPRTPRLGNGNKNAEILIIEDAPRGPDRDELFGGDRGAFFQAALRSSGLEMRRAFYMTLVACRVFSVTEKTETADEMEHDVDPKAAIIKNCHPRVLETIYAVDPRIVLLFGAKAWSTLVNDRKTYNTASQALGELFEISVPGITATLTYPAMAFPGALNILANPSTASFAPGPVTVAALKRVAQYLNTLDRN